MTRLQLTSRPSILSNPPNLEMNPECTICLGELDLTPKGCGCRGSAGMAHLSCLVQAAPHQTDDDGACDGFYRCSTCKHNYSGETMMGLARANVLRRVGLGPEHPNWLAALNNLANALGEAGMPAQAEAIYRRVLSVRQRVHGPTHPLCLLTLTNISTALADMGKYATAETMCRRLLPVMRDVLGGGDMRTLSVVNTLAVALANQGKAADAEPMFRELLEIKTRTLGQGHRITLTGAHSLALNLKKQGSLTEAKHVAANALEAARRSLGESHKITIRFVCLLLDGTG
jgi:tetratricopeptide (TPR) repeat protein